MAVLLWIVLAVVLAIAEAFTATFVLIMFGAGALAAAVVAGLGASLVWQVVAFAVVSGLSLALLRPVIRRHALPAIQGADETIGIKALEGAPGQVIEEVTAGGGLVRIDGELWTAKAFETAQVLAPGERIRVIEVEGTTVLVWRDEFDQVDGDEGEATG